MIAMLSPSSAWLVWPIVVPLVGAVLAFLLPSAARRLAMGVALASSGLSAIMAWWVVDQGRAVRYGLGGWQPPLGITLRADGAALLMVLMTAITGLAVTVYAAGYFQSRIGKGLQTRRHQARERSFWPLWLLLWGALNGLFLSGDIFNIYVCLELVALSSVGLTALSGKPPSLVASIRYLLVGLLGSLSFLLGVAFFYKACGTLELAAIVASLDARPAMITALALVSIGLMLKTALFPFHFWLPPAHANALAPVSALLSGLVVKGSWYLFYRFWQGGVPVALAAGLPALLGGAAIIWGAVQALGQQRLKMLVAYSTVAQVGYLFLAFPLLGRDVGQAGAALCYFAISHSCAKGAMFLAAGTFFLQMGHDRIRDLAGVRQLLPISTFAFALGGLSLMGLPPSGGFIAKYLYASIAISQQRWGLVFMVVAGSGLTAAYIYRAVSSLISPRLLPERPPLVVTAPMQWSALLLALVALLLGVIAPGPLLIMEVGG